MGILKAKEFVDLGLYEGERDVIEDGIRHILRSHPEYKIEIAVEKYKQEKASLGKAADIAGVSLEEMKEILKSRRVSLKGLRSIEEIRRDAEQVRKAMR